MKTYIGVKTVTAWPQGEILHMDGGKDEFRVEPRPGYAVKYPDGYVSWSPKDVFEAAYREVPEEDAPLILEAVGEELERLANGGLIHDAISADDDARRQRDIRETAVHLAFKIHERRGIHAQLDATLKEVFNTASKITAYINEGVVTMPEAKEE